MARQTGIIKLKGTIGDISFYKSSDGYLARGKGGVDGNRIKTDPAFQRTRENGAEFGRAGKGGKLLRTALRVLIQNSKDRKLVSRLTTEMVKVIQEDTTNTRGLRNIIDGEAELLQGFEFNLRAPLTQTLYAPYTTTINRTTGTLTASFPSFVPQNEVAAPAGTTHFKVVSAAAEVDFENETFIADVNDSGMLPWDSTATSVINMSNSVSADSTHPLFLAVGVHFFQEVNGVHYPLKNGAYNSLALVKVSGL